MGWRYCLGWLWVLWGVSISGATASFRGSCCCLAQFLVLLPGFLVGATAWFPCWCYCLVSLLVLLHQCHLHAALQNLGERLLQTRDDLRLAAVDDLVCRHVVGDVA